METTATSLWTLHESVQQTKCIPKTSLCSVHVGRLPLTTTRDDLFDLFSPVAPVRDVWLPKSTTVNSSYTYGFVRFLELNECQSAIRHMNGKTVKGSKIIVEPASSLKQRIKGLDVANEMEWRGWSETYSDAELEKKTLMAGLRIKEQRCPNFSGKNFLKILFRLPVSLSSPGLDKGPICPTMQPSVDSERKLKFNTKQYVDLEHDPQYSTKQTKEQENITTGEVTFDTEYVAFYSPVGCWYTSYAEMQWQQTVEHRHEEERIQELQHKLDTLNEEFRMKSEDNAALQIQLLSSTIAHCDNLPQLFSIQEEILRTEMEIKLQQKASSSRLEHLEILYEKEKIQEGADLYALHKKKLEIDVETARQNVMQSELEGRLLTCRLKMQVLT